MRLPQLIALCLAIAVAAATTLIPVVFRKNKNDTHCCALTPLLLFSGVTALLVALTAFVSAH